MLKWRPFRSTLTFARKLVLALASVRHALGSLEHKINQKLNGRQSRLLSIRSRCARTANTNNFCSNYLALGHQKK